MPKPHAFYEALEAAIQPKMQNILTAEDGDYWKAVRQGAAPCFSVTNMKKVRAQHLPCACSGSSRKEALLLRLLVIGVWKWWPQLTIAAHTGVCARIRPYVSWV
jgi:hypothetical protein